MIKESFIEKLEYILSFNGPYEDEDEDETDTPSPNDYPVIVPLVDSDSLNSSVNLIPNINGDHNPC